MVANSRLPSVRCAGVGRHVRSRDSGLRPGIRQLLAAAMGTVVFATATQARGENRFSVSYMGYGGNLSLSGLPVETDDDSVPDPLRDRAMTMDGNPRTVGGAMRAVLEIDDVRLGIGEAFYGVDGARMRHDPLPPGISSDADNAWGMHLEASLGKRFGDSGLHFYMDVRGALSIVAMEVKLHSDAIGFAGTTTYGESLFSLGPRVGAIAPLGEAFFLDTSAQYSFLGVERWATAAGFGIWFAGEPLK